MPRLLHAQYSLLIGAALLSAALIAAFIGACSTALDIRSVWALLAASTALSSSAFLSHAALVRPAATSTQETPAELPSDGLLARWTQAVFQYFRNQALAHDWRRRGITAAVIYAIVCLSALLAWSSWQDARFVLASSGQWQLMGAMSLAWSVPLFVLHRFCMAARDKGNQVAARWEAMLRLPLACALVTTISALLRSLGYHDFVLLDRLMVCLVYAVALEVTLRTLGWLFMPLSADQAPLTPAYSFLASSLAWRRPRLKAINESVAQQIGVDLSRSWALQFLSRAAWPMLGALAIVCWLLTGISVLRTDQRAVYQRLGDPVEVLGPGLHVHLPWPLGVLRKTELGVVHEMPIVLSSDASQPADATTAVPGDGDIEGVPPPSQDRLWDTTHPYEASYLIASVTDGEQGFQVVNIDLRILYRVALTDHAAMAVTYRVKDPATLIRASAGRMLVQHFSRYTLADVLGENRARFVTSFRDQLQQRLDALDSGEEILAVAVEGIHPPAEAAAAYHNVQAQAIHAQALVSKSQGEAFTRLGNATITALRNHDDALAQADVWTAQARAEATRFNADEQAYREGPEPFLDETMFNHLTRDLPRAPLILIDHRFTASQAPTLDLRRFVPMDPPTNSAK